MRQTTRHGVLTAFICVTLGAQDHRHFFQAASEAWEKGAFREAERGFRQAKTVAQSRVLDEAERITIIVRWTESLLVLGDFGTALNNVRELLAHPLAPSDSSKLNFLLGEAYTGLGHYSQAAESYGNAFQLAKGLIKQHDSELHTILTSSGNLRRLRGDFAGAESDLSRAAEIGRRLPGDNNALVLTAMGYLEMSKQDYARAESTFTAAAKLLPTSKAQDPELGRILLGLGEVDLAINRFAIAKERLSSAENLTSQLTSNPVYLAVQDAIGRLELASGDLAQASIRLRDDCYDSRKANLPEQHPDIASSLDHLALLLIAQEKPEEAIRELTKAGEIFRAAFGPEHPEVATSLQHLGEAYRRLKQFDKSSPPLSEALRIREKIFGVESLAAADTMSAQAALATDEHKFRDAEALYRRVIAIQDKKVPADDPRRLASLAALGFALSSQGKDKEAADIFSSWLRATTLVRGDPRTRAHVLRQLGSIRLGQGDFATAERSFRELLDMPGLDGRERAQVDRDFADALSGQKNFKEAIKPYERAAAGLADPNERAVVWESLGNILRVQSRFDEAFASYRTALGLRVSARGEKSQEAQKTRILLAGTGLEGSKYKDSAEYLRQWLISRSDAKADLKSDEMNLLNNVVRQLLAHRDFVEAEHLLTIELELAEHSPQDPTIDSVLVALAESMEGQGKLQRAAEFLERRAKRDGSIRSFSSAEEFFAHAAKLRERANPIDPALPGALLGLGYNQLAQKKIDAARVTFERCRELLSPRGGDIAGDARAAAFDGLARGAAIRHEYEAAREFLKQALQLLEENPNPAPTVLTAVLYDLGNVAAAENKDVEATSFYQRCLKSLRHEYSREDPPPIDQVNGIAGFFEQHGHYAEAEATYLKALELRRAGFGVGSQMEAQSLFDLAVFYVARKDYKRAVEFAEKALAIFNEKDGPTSDGACVVLNVLASIAEKTGDLGGAIKAKERYWKLRSDSGHMSKMEQDQVLGDLERLYGKQGSAQNVLRTAKTLVDVWRSEGFTSYYYRVAQRDLAIAYEDVKDHRSAISTFKELTHESRKIPVEERRLLLQKYSEALRRNGYVKDAERLDREIQALLLQPDVPPK